MCRTQTEIYCIPVTNLLGKKMNLSSSLDVGFEEKAEVVQQIHQSKRCWVVLTQIRVKYGQTQMLG